MNTLSGNLITNLYEDKLEIEFILFTDCNLNCEFCTNKNTTKSMFDQAILDRFVDDLKNNIDQYKSENVTVHIVGGELFQDKFDHSVFQAYQTFVDKIKEILHDRKVSFEMTSNLIFKKVDRVIQFLVDNDISLSTSYDLYGRFDNEKVKRLWFDNLTKISKVCDVTVSIIKHKYNMLALIEHGDEMFNQLYQNHTIYWIEFILTKYNESFRPSNQLTDIFNQYVVDNYPNCKPYSHIYSRMVGAASATDRCGFETLDITPQSVITKCCDKVKRGYEIVTKLNCFACQYKHFCEIDCPTNFLRNLQDNYCTHKYMLKLLASKAEHETNVSVD